MTRFTKMTPVRQRGLLYGARIWPSMSDDPAGTIVKAATGFNNLSEQSHEPAATRIRLEHARPRRHAGNRGNGATAGSFPWPITTRPKLGVRSLSSLKRAPPPQAPGHPKPRSPHGDCALVLALFGYSLLVCCRQSRRSGSVRASTGRLPPSIP
jgi:hypothetical protein